MSLVPAKCTQCGANIKVDNTKEAGICEACGTAFITEKAISNVNNIISNSVINNYYTNQQILSNKNDYIELGEKYLLINDWDKAFNAFELATQENSNNYKAWLGLAKAETENFTKTDEIIFNLKFNDYLDIAYDVATDEEAKKLDQIIDYYFPPKKKKKLF